ncbi:MULTISPECIES: carbohydrate kinase family protein [Micrococcaceae]|uniref:PfkB domain protein n=1 Tax=Pseudarthrobacter chlorophenolicus (strain ATCC 700700 / DSM 12829 / CIP 107037 / JCM 12360 / KCTC 9906 / NCIMB 13794 / A6) TaxID=452863 RepID=B8HJG9_PSECP|nr:MULTISPECIES: carbohydrate kinase [Micrococcaceae]ACL42567.1 PfkB domain protein [Pseudarthrobacter chlorophenolicus A6]QQQ64309.1 carbohydrate kinase [Paenarthrobacter ureafaciens]SDQ09087.1 fructokinase [Pseudarthrobacter chlorophenolicus]
MSPEFQEPGRGGNVLTVIGESLIDRIQSKTRALVADHVGGSPLNVAVGSARLGVPTRFVTHIGEDEYGELISSHLGDNGVEVVTGGTAPTSTATATLGPDGSASYEFALDWDLSSASLTAWANIETSTHLHTGSIATMLMPGARTVHALLADARETATISYDPNCRPTIIQDVDFARRQAELFVGISDIVKASDEDMIWLYPDMSVEAAMQYWLEQGPSLVIVTRGADGPIALTRQARVELPADRITVADTVGAGDSFMAALIAALDQLDLLAPSNRRELLALDHERLQVILHYAIKASGITCSRAGANPPHLSELGTAPSVTTAP